MAQVGTTHLEERAENIYTLTQPQCLWKKSLQSMCETNQPYAEWAWRKERQNPPPPGEFTHPNYLPGNHTKNVNLLLLNTDSTEP